MRWIFLSFTALAAILVAASFMGLGRSHTGTVVNCVGSTSVQPFAELLAQEYEHVQQSPSAQPPAPMTQAWNGHGAPAPEPVRVDVQGGGSTAGIQAIAEDIADIGMCSRQLKKDEADLYQGIVIAFDGLAVVVHPSNPVADLSLSQIRDIFRGRLTNWNQVGGPDRPIRLITREEGSGTREAFTKLVMEAGRKAGDPPCRISRSAMTQESNGAVKELVKHDRAAIGYMSLGLVHGELRMLAVDGVTPTLEAVKAKRYPLVRPFLFVVKGEPDPSAKGFIDYVLSPAGQGLLQKEGLVSVQ